MSTKNYSGLKSLLAGIIIATGAARMTTGCNNTQKPEYNTRLEQPGNQDFYISIENSQYLSTSQKGLAKRVYDSIDVNAVNPSFKYEPNQDISRKWGFIKTRPLTLEEQVYLTKMEEFSPAWDAYMAIDIRRLNKEEKEFLKEMEKEYGKKPSFDTIKEKAGKKDSKMLDSLKILSGKDYLDTRDFLFLKEIMSAFAFGTSISSNH